MRAPAQFCVPKLMIAKAAATAPNEGGY